MHAIRNTYGRWSKIFCFLFAVHIFNLSVDPRDRQPDFAPEDLSINEIESFAEFIAEIVFGYDGAFDEHDEPDHSEEKILDFHKAFLSESSPYNGLTSSGYTMLLKYFVRNTTQFVPPAGEITSPPPKG
jgi:hypothetical protein